MLNEVLERFFLTSGWGEASTELNAFDAALIKAGIGDTNLVKMSSILPPGAEEVTQAGTIALQKVPGIGKVVATRIWEAWRAREKRVTKRSRVAKGTAAGEARGRSTS